MVLTRAREMKMAFAQWLQDGTQPRHIFPQGASRFDVDRPAPLQRAAAAAVRRLAIMMTGNIRTLGSA